MSVYEKKRVSPKCLAAEGRGNKGGGEVEVLHQTRRPLGKNGGEEGSPRKSSASVLPLLACFLCLTPPPAQHTKKRAGPKLSPSWFVAPVQGQGAALIVKCVQHTQQTGQRGEGGGRGPACRGQKGEREVTTRAQLFPLFFSSKGKRRDHAKPSLPS